MNNYNYLDDAPRDFLQTELIRLHRQRVLMACIIRATQPRTNDNERGLIAEIISELGHIADHIEIEALANNAWYVEIPNGLKDSVTAALTDYLSAGGAW